MPIGVATYGAQVSVGRRLVWRRVLGMTMLVAAMAGLAVILTNGERDRVASVLIAGLIVGGLQLWRGSR